MSDQHEFARVLKQAASIRETVATRFEQAEGTVRELVEYQQRTEELTPVANDFPRKDEAPLYPRLIEYFADAHGRRRRGGRVGDA